MKKYSLLTAQQANSYNIMRVVGEIPNKHCKITLFNWNEKYLVKFEIGMYEQTYKIDEYEIESDQELKMLISEEFVQKVMDRFDHMHNDWGSLTQ